MVDQRHGSVGYGHGCLLHVRSSMEYCSVVWHDNLTQAQRDFKRLQNVSIKIVLRSDYPMRDDGNFDYERAIWNLTYLFFRRDTKTFDFGITCIKHQTLKKHFPFN